MICLPSLRRVRQLREYSSSRVGLIVLNIAAALQLGCGQSDSASPQSGEGIQQYLVGEAARNVGSSSAFSLSSARGDQPGELGETKALEIATAYTREFGPLGRSVFELQHGGPINFGALAPCGRTMYARSSYEPMDGSVDPAVRSDFGPWWIVGLCGGGSRPVFAVAVSAVATSLRVNGDQVIFPAIYGQEIFATGIPTGQESPLAITPEAAVTMTATRGRTLVARVPELFSPAIGDGGPFASFWRVGTEGDVELVGRESRAHVRSSSIFVGLLGGWKRDRRPMRTSAELQLPVALQPDGQDFVGRDMAAMTAMLGRPFTGELPLVSGRARRRPDIPLRFEAVDLPTGGN